MRAAASVLRVPAALAILGLLVWQLGSDAVLDGLRAVGPGTVLAALGLGLLGTLVTAARWVLVARTVEAPLSPRGAVADVYRANLLNAVLPAGLLGDVHRAVRHAGRGGPAGLRAVVLERVSGQTVVVLACAALVAAPVAPLPTGAAVAVVLGAAAVAWSRSPGRVSDRSLRRFLDEPHGPAPDGPPARTTAARSRGPAAEQLPDPIPEPRPAAEPDEPPAATGEEPASGGLRRWLPDRDAVETAVRAWLADARRVLASRTTGPAVVVLSLAALACHLGLFLLAARTAGVDAPLVTLLPLLTAGLLAMMVPIGVGGWGPREGVTAAAFVAAGLDPAGGLAAAVVFGALGLVSCLPGAAVLVLDRGRHRDPVVAGGRRST
ncbi:lysylphosphatidylglycerol synthase transmembrane domain-containing protein [Pseudonocardia nematodicida]|uniref:Lysylphosphatidylglycerol synthase transmembrane domain-containing protein n=1 Tax=Pseudonocardia nematodicida TaxID=1206997 RepID=A0ABV1KFZ3_9PSEU